jgi:catechol 2,3-dioxygenase-like lactoylglutathione lyase family enzyme
VRRFASLLLLAAVPLLCNAKEKPRPKILGIVEVRILTTDVDKANQFYYGIFRTLVAKDTAASNTAEPCNWCERVPNNGTGPVEFQAIKDSWPRNLIRSVALRTDDAATLRHLLKKNDVRASSLTKSPLGLEFSVADPEGHTLIFVQSTGDKPSMTDMSGAETFASPGWPRIIHAGFIVKDRQAMDKFYKDILGFHVYWTGGMKDGETDWVDMQVPDGTDWIEYMLNVPENADKQTLGVMNHIALGVPDVRAAAKQLESQGMKLPEPPQLGRDGKWQLNLYDPDDTRVELMEFTPTQKPCCSDYTGPHPKP